MASQELKFKLSTPSGEFRRLRFAVAPTWSEFQDVLLKTVVPGRSDFVVQYVDDEGDKVSIGSLQEWNEALEIMTETNKKNKQDLLKLFIVDKTTQQQQCQQQQPAAAAQRCQFEGIKSIVEQFLASGSLEVFLSQPQSCEGIKSVLGQFLQPSNLDALLAQLPALLGAQLSNVNKNAPNSDQHHPEQQHHFGRRCGRGPRGPNVDLCRRPPHGFCGSFPPDHRRRFWNHKLHRTGYQFLVEKNYAAAKESYEELIRVAPEDNIALYNLACTYSLISSPLEDGQPREDMQLKAIETLRKAVACGYSKASHMETDADFEPIRNRPEFVGLLASMKTLPQPIPVKVEKEEVPVEKQEEQKPAQPEEQKEASITPEIKDAERCEFEAELKQLEDMGFPDRERNLCLLRRKRGNLGRVLARLLD